MKKVKEVVAMLILDLVGTIVGGILGAVFGAVENGAKDYMEYTGSGRYRDDYETGSGNARGMSNGSLYKEMGNKNRSAGERLAYKNELKNRGY